MPYAASLVDLMAHKKNPKDKIPLMLLESVLDLDPKHVIECERGKVVGLGHGAPFLCDDERAAAVIQIVRMVYPKKYQWRFYEKTKSGWKRI